MLYFEMICDMPQSGKIGFASDNKLTFFLYDFQKLHYNEFWSMSEILITKEQLFKDNTIWICCLAML